MNSICVFCGSHVGEKPEYLESAARLGKMMAENNLRLIYGGSDVGLMGKIANSCLENGGEVIGVMTRKLVDMDVAHSGLNELIVVDSMHQRKAEMAELSDGFMALPGGIGTLEEVLEMFTWVQLGIHTKPIGLLNIKGYYDLFTNFLEQVVNEGFMQAGHLDMLLIDSDEEKLVNQMISYQPKVLSKWADKQSNKINLKT